MSDPNLRFDDEPRAESYADIAMAAYGLVWFVVGMMVGAGLVLGAK